MATNYNSESVIVGVAHGGRKRRFAGILISMLILLTCVGGLAAYSSRSAPPNAPLLIETTYAYDPALPGSEVSHSFTIPNDSDEAFQFHKLTVSCSCTRGDLQDTEIPPHSSTELIARMITPADDGDTHQWIHITGTQGNRAVDFRYHLTSTAASLILLPGRDSTIDLGTRFIGNTDPLKASVTLARGPFPAKWTDVECISDSPTITPHITPIDANHWQLSLAYAPGACIGQFVSHITLQMKNGSELLPQQIRENIIGHVEGPVLAAPSSLLFGLVKQGATVTRTVTLQSDGATTVPGVRKIEVIPPTSRLRVETPTSDHPDQLRIAYTGADPTEEDRGEVVVTLKGPEGYELHISYLARVRAIAEAPRKRTGGN